MKKFPLLATTNISLCFASMNTLKCSYMFTFIGTQDKENDICQFQRVSFYNKEHDLEKIVLWDFLEIIFRIHDIRF